MMAASKAYRPRCTAPRGAPAAQYLLSFLFLLAVSFRGAMASLTVESAGVRIVSPPGYRARIDWALADFGEAKYGGLMLGRAVYLTEDTQYYAPNNTNRPKCQGMMEAQYACVSYDMCGPFKIQKERGTQYIALVDRGPEGMHGPCYFVSKVYHAQQAGADAVLVVNNHPGDDLSTAIVPEAEMYQRMAGNITVSAGMISQGSGQLIKSLLKGGQVVTLALNWTDSLPRTQHIKWELWTNSNDECGTLCKQQLDFIKAMKPVSKQFQDGGRVTFTPHYVTWACTEDAKGSPGCRSMCIRNGRYCAQDPDDDISQGYSGRDVLAINMRQLCFFRLANASGQPELWWDYVQDFAANCSMAAKKYNPDCAAEVFTRMGGPSLLGGRGLEEWQKCVPDILNETYGAGDEPIAVFEEELARQYGDDDEKGITLVPTIRIDGKEYRGKLDVAGVTRALCASFPVGTEPPLCNEQWVSENECEVQAVGYTKCRVGAPEAQGRNRCTNTFSGAGYTCQCGQGWLLMSDPGTGEQSCEDLNECQATSIMQSHANCSCERCACINTIGSFNCTGPLPNRCDQQHDYNGCWRQFNGGVVQSHACVDGLEQYRADAAGGRLMPGQSWTFCRCPHCGSGDAVTSCTPCNGECLESLNMCRSNAPAPKPSPGGTSTAQVTLIVLLTVAIMVALMFAAYHFVLKSRMNNEIRSIMSQYMPLAGMEAGQGPGPGQGPGGAHGGSSREYSATASAPDVYNDPWAAPAPTRGRAAGGGGRTGRGQQQDGSEEARPLMLGPSSDADQPLGAGADGATDRGSGLGFGVRGAAGAQWLPSLPGRKDASHVTPSSGHEAGVALGPLGPSATPTTSGRVALVAPLPAAPVGAGAAKTGFHGGAGAEGGDGLPTSKAPLDGDASDPLQAVLLGGGAASDQLPLR